MNRVAVLARQFLVSVPRDRGDEPPVIQYCLINFSVFPATVGMNRHIIGQAAKRNRVPRDRGDEPL